MRFTVIFDSPEDRDYSYGLVFVPSPVWVQGSSQILNLNPEDARYTIGSVRRLLAVEPTELAEGSPKQCVVLAHGEGNGTFEDLRELMRDLELDGFRVTLLKSA